MSTTLAGILQSRTLDQDFLKFAFWWYILAVCFLQSLFWFCAFVFCLLMFGFFVVIFLFCRLFVTACIGLVFTTEAKRRQVTALHLRLLTSQAKLIRKGNAAQSA